jgi:cholesterol oxidase
MTEFDYDVLVVGSGFGGSVTALRLTEKGYRVGVLEAGRRYTDETLPKTSWRLRKFLYAPKLGLHGIQRITLLKDVLVLTGCGVGGGSLVYANTLYEPLGAFYDDAQWRHITDWRDELAPFYDQAKRMLGVVQNPTITPSDEAMKKVADEMGVGDTFHLTPVAVFFGDEPGKQVDDPFFGGEGPRRTGCIECGNCMIGCRYGAKNRLDTNYLHLAERNGTVVHPDTTVRTVRPLDGGGYAVDAVRSGSWHERRTTQTFTAEQVVFSAGGLGTQKLLHAMRDEGVLPNISPRLGMLTRTNSESLLGATAHSGDVDYSQGVAITSSFYPDDHTHIEPVRYGKGSNMMGMLSSLLTDGGGPVPRWLKFLGQALSNPPHLLRSMILRHWSERTIIALVMQSLDNSISTHRKTNRLFGARLSSRPGHGEPNPTWIPAGNDAVRRLARVIDGSPGGSIGEIANIPMTAHFIGGCAIGDSAETGVIDPYQRLYGHEGLHVVDGSALSANLGVNPSLSITAQAERSMALWPNKGEVDLRPLLGAAYRRIEPVFPRRPAVPIWSAAALRFEAPESERVAQAAPDRLAHGEVPGALHAGSIPDPLGQVG